MFIHVIPCQYNGPTRIAHVSFHSINRWHRFCSGLPVSGPRKSKSWKLLRIACDEIQDIRCEVHGFPDITRCCDQKNRQPIRSLFQTSTACYTQILSPKYNGFTLNMLLVGLPGCGIVVILSWESALVNRGGRGFGIAAEQHILRESLCVVCVGAKTWWVRYIVVHYTGTSGELAPNYVWMY